MTVTIDTGEDSYSFGISGPDRTPLHVGRYADAERDLFQRAGHPGLDLGVPDRGCNDVSGEFTVNEIRYDASGSVTALAVDFLLHCDTNRAALRGTLDVEKPTRQ